MTKTDSNVKRLEEGHCKQIEIKNDYRFVDFSDTGTGGTTMIMENIKTKQVRFVLLLYSEDAKKDG